MNDYKAHHRQEQMSFSSNTVLATDAYYDPTCPSSITYHEPIGVGILQSSIDPFATPFNTYHTSSNVFDVQGLISRSNGQTSSHSGGCSATFIQSRLIPSKYTVAPRVFKNAEMLADVELECQESLNEDTMLSEPVLPVMEGFPDVNEFDELMQSYVSDLSAKKQDKALIHAKRARNIKTVLADPKDTAVESAQFRFWVKKMFKLQPQDKYIPDSKKMIYHEGKPVAIREKLFKVLTQAHKRCQHGGRDKTSAQVRRFYSWVPKELISRFVKICPTCQSRRGVMQMTPSGSRGASPRLEKAIHSQSNVISYFPGGGYPLKLPEFTGTPTVGARLDNPMKEKLSLSANLPEVTQTFRMNGRSLSSFSLPQPVSANDESSLIQVSRGMGHTTISFPMETGYNTSCVGHTGHYDY